MDDEGIIEFITSGVDRFLNRPPLRNEALDGVRCREVHPFRKFCYVEIDNSLHDVTLSKI